MKTTLDRFELEKLNACEDGYNTFVRAHGDNKVTLSQALESNGWDDIWWYISNAYGEFSEQQKKELHLLGCDWALTSIDNFEREFPDDERPRKAIEAKKLWLDGKITDQELAAARSAAWSAESAAMEKFTSELMQLFKLWEGKQA